MKEVQIQVKTEKRGEFAGDITKTLEVHICKAKPMIQIKNYLEIRSVMIHS